MCRNSASPSLAISSGCVEDSEAESRAEFRSASGMRHSRWGSNRPRATASASSGHSPAHGRLAVDCGRGRQPSRSGRVAVVVAQESAKAFAALDAALSLARVLVVDDELAAQPLMVTLAMIVDAEGSQGATQMRFAQG